MEALPNVAPNQSQQTLTQEALAWRDFEQAYRALTTMDEPRRDTAKQELREALRRIKSLVEDRGESTSPAGRFERVLVE